MENYTGSLMPTFYRKQVGRYVTGTRNEMWDWLRIGWPMINYTQEKWDGKIHHLLQIFEKSIQSNPWNIPSNHDSLGAIEGFKFDTVIDL